MLKHSTASAPPWVPQKLRNAAHVSNSNILSILSVLVQNVIYRSLHSIVKFQA
jgi:hypothetical protein